MQPIALHGVRQPCRHRRVLQVQLPQSRFIEPCAIEHGSGLLLSDNGIRIIQPSQKQQVFCPGLWMFQRVPPAASCCALKWKTITGVTGGVT
ncbi:hypothetical protein D3C81_836360 [compost metagenome]